MNSKKRVIWHDQAKDTIHIADFWDTRREPKTQAEQVNDQPAE